MDTHEENTELLSIIDIIDHKCKYGILRYVVLNRKLRFLYEKVGNWLIGEDSGFFSFYYYERPSGRFKAFAGREFDIPLKTGEVIKANGQWWDGVPQDYREQITHVGYGIPQGLSKCNVFCATNVKPAIIEEWLSKNIPSDNYYKYSPKHKDFGKHLITGNSTRRTKDENHN